MSSIDDMMKKAVTTKETFYNTPHAVQGYKDRKDAIRDARREQKTTLSQWYGMRKAKLGPDEKQELELLQYRNFIDPDVAHQAPKKTSQTNSEFVEFGFFTDVGRNKRKRYKSFADEWIEVQPSFAEVVKKRIKRNVKMNKKSKLLAARKAAADVERAKTRKVSKRKSRHDIV